MNILPLRLEICSLMDDSFLPGKEKWSRRTGYLPFYFWVRSGFGDAAGWWKEVVDCAPWIAGHILSAFLISLYNGELGYHAKWFRRLYYSFYPVHMLVIGIICMLIGI